MVDKNLLESSNRIEWQCLLCNTIKNLLYLNSYVAENVSFSTNLDLREQVIDAFEGYS